MVSTKTSLFRFQTVPIKIPFSIRLHQSSVGNRSSMTARIKCSVGSNIGIHLPPTFPKKNNFGEKASLFWFQIAPMKTPFSKPRPRSRNVKNPKIVLQYRHTCLLFHYFQEKISVVSISNRSDKNSISISIQFHPLLRGGKWQDGRWSPLKQWSVTNWQLLCAILSGGRGFDSIRFQMPNSWAKEVDSGARSLVACCDAACYIGWNLLTLRQRPRLLDAVHVSSNVTPCRAATKSCIDRVPLVLALWGGDPSRVSDRISAASRHP